MFHGIVFLLAQLFILSKLTYCFCFSRIVDMRLIGISSRLWRRLLGQRWLLPLCASSATMQLAVQFAFVAWNKDVWLESWLSISSSCSNVWTFFFIFMFKTFGCTRCLSLVGHVMYDLSQDVWIGWLSLVRYEASTQQGTKMMHSVSIFSLCVWKY
jgi:hypothetical protein